MTRKIGRLVSCVVLCRSEATDLEQYVDALTAVLRGGFSEHEIVLVSDGVVHGLAAAIERVLTKHSYIRLLQLTQPNGDHVAATAGLEAAIGDYLCVLDSANDPPELVCPAVATAIEGPDVVFGIDRGRSRRNWFARFLGVAFIWYARRFLELEIAHGRGTFRCLSRYAVNSLVRLTQPHRYYRIWGDYVGLSTVNMNYDGRGHPASRGLVASIDEALDIVISVSPHPLRMVSGLAMLFGLANVTYIAYIVVIFIFNPNVATGWTTLSMQVAFLSLVMILLLAALSEYVGRVLERVSPNPAYWVREERTSKRFSGVERRLNVVEQSIAVDLDATQR